MLDKKQIRVILLFEFKMSYKAAETPCTITTFGPGAAHERTVHWWFRKSYEGSKSPEDEEHGWPVIGRWQRQLRAITKADPLTTTQEVAKELNIHHSMVIGIWNKLERWKSSVSGSLASWPQI